MSAGAAAGMFKTSARHCQHTTEDGRRHRLPPQAPLQPSTFRRMKSCEAAAALRKRTTCSATFSDMAREEQLRGLGHACTTMSL